MKKIVLLVLIVLLMSSCGISKYSKIRKMANREHGLMPYKNQTGHAYRR